MFKNLIRALRLPFSTASVLPFIFGSLLAKGSLKLSTFLLGLIAVLFTHLAANLLNDYADSKTGADWQDRRFYGFFGGSKLIQEGVFSENFYRNLAFLFSALALAAVISLVLILNSLLTVGFYILIVFLGFSYSAGPLQLSYRRLGELTIFILFGPALVMGGYFIQTKIFPTLEGFILSLPFGLLTAAILYANEIPDVNEDIKAKKLTLVSVVGQEKAFILYYILVGAAFGAILLAIFKGYLSPLALTCFVFLPQAFKAAAILKKDYAEKSNLVVSSKLTIAVHSLVSIVLILDLLI